MMRKGATFSAGDRYGTLKPDLQYRVVLLDGSDFIVEVNVSVYSFGVTDHVTNYETYAKTNPRVAGVVFTPRVSNPVLPPIQSQPPLLSDQQTAFPCYAAVSTQVSCCHIMCGYITHL